MQLTPLTTIHTDTGPERVEMYARLTYTIDGRVFDFTVTADLNGFHKNVTHLQSGKIVCPLSVARENLSTYTKKITDSDRARYCLQLLVSKHGESRVAAVLSAAPKLQDQEIAHA